VRLLRRTKLIVAQSNMVSGMAQLVNQLQHAFIALT